LRARGEVAPHDDDRIDGDRKPDDSVEVTLQRARSGRHALRRGGDVIRIIRRVEAAYVGATIGDPPPRL